MTGYSKDVGRSKSKKTEHWLHFTFKQRRVHILLDKVLLLRFLRRLHGRFWGVTGISIMLLGFSVCFAIRPDLVSISTAFSDFGDDVRTAPYFAGSVFFAAYGMWRWHYYLARTWKNTRLIVMLVFSTVIGLYLIALMPVSWEPWPHRIHMFGVILAGTSMLAAVVLDGLLTRVQRGVREWRYVRLVSVIFIVSGGWLTFGSAKYVGWYDVSLLGESLLLAGYFLWIVMKTYLGEGNRSRLSLLISKLVKID
jgi:hypothetical protein